MPLEIGRPRAARIEDEGVSRAVICSSQSSGSRKSTHNAPILRFPLSGPNPACLAFMGNRFGFAVDSRKLSA